MNEYFEDDSIITTALKEKFEEIPKYVFLGLLQPGKTIEQIADGRSVSDGGEQEKYRSKPIWHNKRDMNTFVQKKLGLTDTEISIRGPNATDSIFSQRIVREIMNLRKNKTIVDWTLDSRPGIWRLTYSDQIPKNEPNGDTLTGNYFIITQNPESKYDDIPGVQYAYDNHKPHYTKFIEGTNFIVQTKTDNQYYFVGYGKVGSIKKSEDMNEKGNPITKIIAKFSKYTKFEEPKIRTDEINEKMLKLAFPKTGFNSQPPAMLPITPSLYREIIEEDLVEQKQPTDTLGDLELNPFIEALKWKPNLILYGPPGTGKTFTAKEIAKEVQKENNLPDFFMLKGPWSNWELNISRDNPSWATTDEQSNVSQYNLMKIGDYAILQNTGDDLGPYDGVGYFGIGKITKLFDSVEPFFADELEAGKIIWQKRLEFELIKKVDRKQMIPRIDGLPGTKGLSRIADIDNIKKLVEKIASEWGVILRTKLVTFHQTFSYEEFIEGIKANPTKDKTGVTYDVEDGIFKDFCNMASKDSTNKYVIIIDEINRGNIAKIFGELITIIENDKRGTDVTLAYSKKSFSVPKNVLIIGTMNTADQSLTHLDAALKRRFTMMEHYPNPKILKNYKVNDDIDLSVLLDAINKKLIENNFRDGQIGHSYFMDGEEPITKISDLQMVFAYDIIPLLRDYFYDDESKLTSIFGNHWFDENKDINKDWQGSSNTEKFRNNLHTSFGV
jgi:5-methylcytosine-specific restriction endonuclease McrBC GTP-binding regulatory subunit McrB